MHLTKYLLRANFTKILIAKAEQLFVQVIFDAFKATAIGKIAPKYGQKF
jgi:hypothetical protein